MFLFPRVTINTIELTLRTSCYCVVDLLCDTGTEAYNKSDFASTLFMNVSQTTTNPITNIQSVRIINDTLCLSLFLPLSVLFFCLSFCLTLLPSAYLNQNIWIVIVHWFSN